jgi:hypothetical protein
MPAAAKLLILPHPCFRPARERGPLMAPCVVLPFAPRGAAALKPVDLSGASAVPALPWPADLFADAELTD